MTKHKNRVEVPPPEEFPLGYAFRCQVTPNAFAIFDSDFNQIIRFCEDDGSITATAGNAFTGCGPDGVSKFAERLWQWAKAAERSAECYRD